MKRLFLLLVVALATALGFAWWLTDDPGYLLIIRDNWEIETSLAFALLVLVLGAILLVVLALSLASLWNLLAPLRMSERWRRQLAGRRLKSGLYALLEGRWKKAEKQLAAAARRGDWSLPGWLGAALAAEMGDQRQRTREHLAEAARCPKGDLPAGLLLAWLATGEGALPRARAELEILQRKYQDNPLVLRQLAEVYERGEHWQALADLLPALGRLERNRVAVPLRERRVWLGLLRDAAERGEPVERLETLRALWKRVPAGQRSDPAVVAAYVGYLARLGDGAGALKLVSRRLKQDWDDRLATTLEKIDDLPPEKLLDRLEQWLADRPGSRPLLISAGRVALKARLWGKARSFFEAAGDHPVALAELARLYQALGEEQKARLCLDRRLRLINAGLPELPLPENRASAGQASRGA